VVGDQGPTGVCQLTIEEVVELMDRIIAVHRLPEESAAAVHTRTVSHLHTSSFDRST
jgi:hypothetical protein